MYPLNRSMADLAMIALQQRGVRPEALARALSIGLEQASAMLATYDAELSVAAAKKIEALAGTSFVALTIEGAYVRHRDHPDRIAELDQMRSTIYADLDIRLPGRPDATSGAASLTAARRSAQRRKVS